MEDFTPLSLSPLITSHTTPPLSVPHESEQVQQREQQQQQSLAYRLSVNRLAAYGTNNDVWTCTAILLTFCFLASMMLILGFYGSVDLVSGSSVSKFVQANSLSVQDIKFSICLKTTQKENTVGESENGIALLYGFVKSPPLHIQTTWSETYDASFPAKLHKEWVYYLNGQAHINISNTVKSNASSPLILVIAEGSESLILRIRNPTHLHIPISWSVIHGNGMIQQSIVKPSDYYIAVDNLNQQEMEVARTWTHQLRHTDRRRIFKNAIALTRQDLWNSNTVSNMIRLVIEVGLVTIQNTLLYNATEANYKCSIGHSSCAFQLPSLRENAAVLTTSGPEQVYLLIFKIFTNFLACSGNYVEQQNAAVSEGRSPLLFNKEDDHLSLGSSYDSISNDEEDVEEQLDVPTKVKLTTPDVFVQFVVMFRGIASSYPAGIVPCVLHAEQGT